MVLLTFFAATFFLELAGALTQVAHNSAPEWPSLGEPLAALLFYFKHTWAAESTILFSYAYVGKLVVSWFLIVWLRLNLMRYRFDQVASYTWHELVVYSTAILLEIIIAYAVL